MKKYLFLFGAGIAIMILVGLSGYFFPKDALEYYLFTSYGDRSTMLDSIYAIDVGMFIAILVSLVMFVGLFIAILKRRI